MHRCKWLGQSQINTGRLSIGLLRNSQPTCFFFFSVENVVFKDSTDINAGAIGFSDHSRQFIDACKNPYRQRSLARK